MAKHGFQDDDWDAATREGTEVLAAYAKQRQMVSYSDFVNRIHAIRFEGPHDLRLRHFLGEISKAESEAGRGMLTALVVHKTGDMQPGPGFFELAKELGYDVGDIEKVWVKQIKKVFSVWTKS